MMLQTQYLSVLVVFAVALTLAAAQAQATLMTVNFDFGCTAVFPSRVVYSGVGAASDTATYWNDLEVHGGSYATTVNSYTGTAYASDGTTVSGVELWLVNNTASQYLDSSPGPLTNLFGNYANYYTGTTPQTSANGPGFTIGGSATNGIYSLYLYSCSGKWANNFNDFLVGGVQKNLTNSTDTSFVQNNNYVKFTGLTPASDDTISGTYWAASVWMATTTRS